MQNNHVRSDIRRRADEPDLVTITRFGRLSPFLHYDTYGRLKSYLRFEWKKRALLY